jgi:hypothetical protein
MLRQAVVMISANAIGSASASGVTPSAASCAITSGPPGCPPSNATMAIQVCARAYHTQVGASGMMLTGTGTHADPHRGLSLQLLDGSESAPECASATGSTYLPSVRDGNAQPEVHHPGPRQCQWGNATGAGTTATGKSAGSIASAMSIASDAPSCFTFASGTSSDDELMTPAGKLPHPYDCCVLAPATSNCDAGVTLPVAVEPARNLKQEPDSEITDSIQAHLPVRTDGFAKENIWQSVCEVGSREEFTNALQ